MNLSKDDLLKLLTMLEGELQAKEIFIAILKTEQVKQLLHPCLFRNRLSFFKSPITSISNQISSRSFSNQDVPFNYSQISKSEPYSALLRDTYSALDPNFDSNSLELVLNLEEKQFNALIFKQRIIRKFLESKIVEMNSKYKACFDELEIEKRKIIEFEREKILKQVNDLNQEKLNLLQDIEMLELLFRKEKEREKQMIICLLNERKQLIVELIEEKQNNSELNRLLTLEKKKNAVIIEDLEEESKRSLQMESELEKAITNFEKEKQLLESETEKLKTENFNLKQELIKSKNLIPLDKSARSTIVTINSIEQRVSPSVQTVAALNQSKLSHASLVSSNRSSNTLNSQLSDVVSSTTLKYATLQPTHKSTSNNSSIHISSQPILGPTLPSHPSTSSSTTTAFQNIAYNSNTPPIPSNSQPVPMTSSVAKLSTPGISGKTISSSSISQIVPPVSKKLTSPANSSAHSTVTGPVFTRGAPPPIPPNKPILTPNALKEKSKELQSVRAAKLLAAKCSSNFTNSANISVNVTNTTSTSPAMTTATKTSVCLNQSAKSNNKMQSNQKQILNGAKNKESSNLVKNINNVDMICQELADFQQLLVSMESNKSLN